MVFSETVEEQSHDGPGLNLALGIVRKDFAKIERAVSAGAREVDTKISSHEATEELGYDFSRITSTSSENNLSATDPLELAMLVGFDDKELNRLKEILR